MDDAGDAGAPPAGSSEDDGGVDAPDGASPDAPPDDDGVAPSDAPADRRTSREPVPTVAVGRAMARRFAVAGTRFAFTVPGESFLGLLDGLVAEDIRVVATRHEGGAAFMASVASQLTGRPQLCLATRAVGASNLAIGIHTARADSSPLIAVCGQVRRAHRGREAFQEADLAGSIGRLAKWAGEVDRPGTAPELAGQAIRHALEGRPGPSLLSVPEDILDVQVRDAAGRSDQPRTAAATADEVRAVLRMLAESRRGVILAGAGVLRANAGRRVMRLAEALGIPVIAAWRRPDVVPNGHPLYLGMAGYAAPSTVLPRLREADALLVIGSRLSEVTSFDYRIPARTTRWAHVDLEPAATVAWRGGPDIPITSDAGRFTDMGISLLRGAAIEATGRQARLDAAEADRHAYLEASVVDAGEWDGPGVHPGRVVAELRRQLPAEAIVVTDAGNFGGWAARGYRFRRPGTFLGPTSGAMGFALPAAIAAAIVQPRRPVVALAGDGGFAMTMAEIETAVREGVAPVVLVFDNRRYGTIRMHQEREGRAPSATELGAIDFAAVARGLGAEAATVESDADFPEALRAALAAGRPAVLHLRVDPAWVSVDQTPTGSG